MIASRSAVDDNEQVSIERAMMPLKNPSNFILLIERVIIPFGIVIIIFVFAAISLLMVAKQYRDGIATEALNWMETQNYPDVCGPQGQFPHKHSNGKPCFTKNGYRFISGQDTYEEWTTPFRRIVKLKPEGQWTTQDNVVTWTNDWLINRMQLYTSSARELENLVKAIPEIEN